MKKTTLFLAMLLTASSLTFAQYTAIPDAVFEQYLVDSFIDSEGGPVDGQILTADANAYAGIINTSTLAVADFTGIEAFTSMVGLNVSYNNAFTTLDLTSNTALTDINAEACTGLNSLTITGLNVLTVLNLFDNDLTVLELSTNTALETLDVRQNELLALDLSNNGSFVSLNCRNNQLVLLDMRNGNNANVVAFNSDFNNDLTCIYVDDSSAPYLASWSIDMNSVFANDAAECATLSTVDQNLVTFNMFPNPARNSVNVSSSEQASSLEVYNITGKLVLTKSLSFGSNTVNISELSSGVYLARFTSENTTETKKLIIN